MNQDSEKNDRDRRTGTSRDGDPQRRTDRSTGRRDDARNQGEDRPRFSRDTDRPSYNRSSDADRPRSNRDADRSGNREDRPNRFSRDTNNRPDWDRPRFSRDNDRRSDDRRPNRDGDSDRPRFDRGGSRPDNNRDNRFQSDKPRFDRDRRDSREEEPRRGGEGRSFGDQSRSFRPSAPPRFNRDDKPRFNEDRSRERFERSDREGRRDEDRPRFSRNERFQPDGSRPDDRPAGPSRFNRDDKPRGTGRFNDGGREERPRFNRDGQRGNRDEKPAFKRVGGFSREADERNKARSAEEDNSRGYNRRNERDKPEESRFTGQQRKESGERRTGMYTKAPNYNLEERRASFERGRSEKPRGEKRGVDEKPKRQAGSDGPNTTRLNRYIANSGVCSRREADELIAQGDISVNGKVVTEMGYKVKDGDTVKYGTKVLNPERFVYVLLNKPKDYITTTEDPEERKTVMELVADAGNFRMYPVGRLDRNTTGLLLFTNDGEVADKLTHPSNNVRKIYQVELDKPITDEHFEALKKGIELEDGPIKPDALSIVTPDAYVVGIEIHSGRNRIVRRMFEHFGYEVSKLDRTTYAGLTKKDLPRGKWRFLDPKEVVKLKYLNS